MRASTLAMVTICLAVPTIVSAVQTEFPYEAVVQSDGVIVRCGPGERYDPTMKLSSGQQITVHRHDPGGWFVISPPPGSFSWINADYVQPTEGGKGIVQAPHQGDGLPPRVVVWIGSQFTSEHKIFGRRLATGDEVTIIGDKIQPTDQGPTKFYQIEPPRLENRWIKGDYVIPLSEVGSVARSTATPAPISGLLAPFGGSSAASTLTSTDDASPGFPVEREPTLLERELTRAIESDAAVKSGTPAVQLNQDRTHLQQLDGQLQTMLTQDPGTWALDSLELSYRDLQASASPGVAGMIDARLETISARKIIKAEYDAFVQVTTQTSQRDAELLSLQNSALTGLPIETGPVQLGQPLAVPAQLGQPVGTGQPSLGSVGPNPGVGRPEMAPSTASSPQDDIFQLDGAGIITRIPATRPGMPPHALVSPDGRLLAYLRAEQGINLDAHLGQSVGVIGRRTHEPRLRSDLIIVQRLAPVRLDPPTQGGS